jgi:hypothetical protein
LGIFTGGMTVEVGSGCWVCSPVQAVSIIKMIMDVISLFIFSYFLLY